MRTLLLTTLSIFIATITFSQENALKNETAKLISSLLTIRDVNSIEQQKSDTINELFRFSLNHYLEGKKVDESAIKKAFLFLHRNGSSDYSDSPDERSMKFRRASCFASLALLSKRENQYTFMEYSLFSMLGSIENPDRALLETPFLGLMWLQILIKYGNNNLSREDLKKIKTFIDTESDHLPFTIKEQSNSLIKAYETMFGIR